MFRRKTMKHFTDLIMLYETVSGKEGTEEYEKSSDALKKKYLHFRKTRLDEIIDDMKKVRSITKSMLDKNGVDKPDCSSLQYWMMRIYRFHRYIFVSTYYYIVPFLILVFQTILLYSHEIYSQYLIDKAAEAAVADLATSATPEALAVTTTTTTPTADSVDSIGGDPLVTGTGLLL